MSDLVDIAEKIIELLEAGITSVSDIRYGLATSTGVITGTEAIGVCLLSSKEEPLSVGANLETIVYQIWAYAKPSPPSTPADAEEEVVDLIEQVETTLRGNPYLGNLVMSSELSAVNFNYEEIQPGIYAATAVLDFTVRRMVNL